MLAGILFWIDCSERGCWLFVFCFFGNNTARRYLCPEFIRMLDLCQWEYPVFLILDDRVQSLFSACL